MNAAAPVDHHLQNFEDHMRKHTSRPDRWIVPLLTCAVLVAGACSEDEQAASPADNGGQRQAQATAQPAANTSMARRVTTLVEPAYGVAIGPKDQLASMLWTIQTVRFRSARGNDLSPRDVQTGSTPVHGAFDRDGGMFYVVEQDGQALRKIVTASGATTAVDYGHPMFNIAISPVDGMVFVTTGDGWLFKADPGTLAKLDSLWLGSASNGLAINANGFWVATLGGTLLRVDPGTLDQVDQIDLGGRPQRMAIDAAAATAYVANEGGLGLQVVDLAGHTVRSIPVDGIPYGLALTPDDATVWVALRDVGRVDAYETGGMTRTGSLSIGGVPRNIAFNANGHLALVANQTATLLVER